MKFAKVTRLLGIQTSQDPVDQQNGSFRQADGAVCWPKGALTLALPWGTAWSVTDLPAACLAVLGAYSTGTHVVQLIAGSTKALILYSFSTGIRGIFTLAAANQEIDFTASASFSTPAGAWAHNLDASAQWFASPIGGIFWMGNGIDANLAWDGSTVRTLGNALPSGQYARAKVVFPPCTTFIVGEENVIFGAGNAAEPMKIWLTERPASTEEYIEGIFSLETSYTKLSYPRGTKITALTSWNRYVVAHTDNGAAVLFGFKQTGDGYISQQHNSATHAGAINPACARGLNGIGTLWLGTDGEIYKDDSSRAGPTDKLATRDRDIATYNSAEYWNRGLAITQANRPPSLAYDARQGMAWVNGYNALTGGNALWCMNEGLGQITGPYHAPDFSLVADCGWTKTFTLLGVTTAGALLYFKSSGIEEAATGVLTWPVPALGSQFYALASKPVSSTPGQTVVGVNPTTGAFSIFYPGAAGAWAAREVGVTSPSGDIGPVTNAGLTQFYANANLALLEFPLLDMGTPGMEKVIQEGVWSWASHSKVLVGVWAQNEMGHSDWRWAGQVYPQERQFSHLNLLGSRIRLRVFAISFHGERAILRDAVLGYLGGNVI